MFFLHQPIIFIPLYSNIKFTMYFTFNYTFLVAMQLQVRYHGEQQTRRVRLTTTTIRTIIRCKLMDNVLDSVPHQMSGQGYDDLSDGKIIYNEREHLL